MLWKNGHDCCGSRGEGKHLRDKSLCKDQSGSLNIDYGFSPIRVGVYPVAGIKQRSDHLAAEEIPWIGYFRSLGNVAGLHFNQPTNNMTNKAIITRRDGSAFADNAEAGALMERLGVKKTRSHGAGMLIEASDKELVALEKAGYRVKLLPETEILRIGNYVIDTDKAAPKVPKELEVPKDLADTWPQHLVQLIAPPTEEWKEAIAAQGVEVVEKVSRYGLYVKGTPEQVKGLEKLPFVVWTGPLKPGYRIAGRLWDQQRSAADVDVLARIFSDQVKEVEQWVIGHGGSISRMPDRTPANDPCRWITLKIPGALITPFAQHMGVRYLDLLPETVLLDERAAQIVMGDLDTVAAPSTGPNVGYQNNLTDLGLSGAGVNIAICDSGIDTHDNATMQADLAGRMTFFADQTSGAIVVDRNGHGTHVAGIAAGNATTADADPGGFRLGQGIAPGSTFGSINGISGAAALDLDGWIGVASNNGSDVMNNSWGTAMGGVGLFNQGYTGLCAQLDGLVRDADPGASGTQEVIQVFAAGNSGSALSTTGEPSEAKNAIIVGNSLNRRLNEGDLDDIRGLRSSSSRGPAVDLRFRPDVIAPGSDIISTRPGPTVDSDPATAGIQQPRVAYSDTSGTVHPAHFANSGTSMAAPQVSGVIALLIEWWRNITGGNTPSAAMVKAILVNGAIDCAGGPTRRGAGLIANIPNNDQGWGRVNLQNMVTQSPASDRGSKIYRDQRNAFTTNGQEHVMRISPVNVARPLRISLAWTDAAGAAGANPALVNDLDLEVTEVGTGNVFKGNVFNNGFSVTGGAFDDLNNVECVYIQNPNGVYEVRVIAASITASAHPDIATAWQDFALVVDNAEYAEASPVAVVPVIDRSGSMVGAGYVDITRTASKQFIGLMGVDDQFGVVSFGSTANVEHPSGAAPALVTITGDLDNTAGQTAVDGIAFGGSTHMGKGLEKGRDLLLPSGLSKAIVLLSDGFDNGAPSAISVATSLPANLPVYSCAMGPLSDQTLLNDIANVTDGKYYFMPTIDDLFEIYNYIRGQVSGDSIVTNESAMASSSRVACVVEGCAKRATFTVAWADPKLKFTADRAMKSNLIAIRLRDPKGKLLHPNAAHVRRTVGEGFVAFDIVEPLAGKWYVEVSTAIERHTRYTVGGFVDSPVRMHLALGTHQAYVGKPIEVYAKIRHNKDVISGFRATASVTRGKQSLKDLLHIHAKQINVKSAVAKRFTDDGMPNELAGLAALVAERTEPLFAFDRSTTNLLQSAVSASVLDRLVQQGRFRIPEGFQDVHGLLRARLAAPAWAGSTNVAITAYGWSPKCGTRFVRKDMVSVLAKG